MSDDQCCFVEPWIGRCKELSGNKEACCEKHSKEKCQVCGEQATTRCQASIGVMCGVPLCGACGYGEMCLDHASSGPVMVIAALLGRGPIVSVFATQDSLKAQADEMNAIVDRLQASNHFGKHTMEEFNRVKKTWDDRTNAKSIE